MTDAEILELVTCPKRITQGPKEPKRIQQDWRTGMQLEADDGRQFTVYTRQHSMFDDNFSIGLCYGRLHLRRYNSHSGTHTNKVLDRRSFTGPHIHKATEAALRAGLKLENEAEPTDRYRTFEQALTCFLTDVNITNATEYFGQLKLPIDYSESS